MPRILRTHASAAASRVTRNYGDSVVNAPGSSETPELPGSQGKRLDRRRSAGTRTLRTLESGHPAAPVALMLHGVPGGAEDWNRLGALLSARFRVIAVDRPGYGSSGRDALPVAEQVDVYAALLRSLVPTPALVVGHSYGALPAAELAARHPELVGALGLLAPALRENRADREPPPFTEAVHRLMSRPAVGAFVRATILSEAGRAAIARVADPRSFDPDPVDEEHLAGVRDRTLQWDALRSFAVEATSLTRDGSVVDGLLGTIRAPSVVIHAAGDRVVEPAAGRRTARSIPHCEHHELEGGHMFTISRAGEVAPILERLAERAGLLSETAPREPGQASD